MGFLDFLKTELPEPHTETQAEPRTEVRVESGMEKAFVQAIVSAQAGTKTLFMTDQGTTKEMWEISKRQKCSLAELQSKGLLKILRTDGQATPEAVAKITDKAISEGIQLIVFYISHQSRQVQEEAAKQGVKTVFVGH
ncbi:hypothetical protein ACFLQ2_05235 [archaeon]